MPGIDGNSLWKRLRPQQVLQLPALARHMLDSVAMPRLQRTSLSLSRSVAAPYFNRGSEGMNRNY